MFICHALDQLCSGFDIKLDWEPPTITEHWVEELAEQLNPLPKAPSVEAIAAFIEGIQT